MTTFPDTEQLLQELRRSPKSIGPPADNSEVFLAGRELMRLTERSFGVQFGIAEQHRMLAREMGAVAGREITSPFDGKNDPPGAKGARERFATDLEGFFTTARALNEKFGTIFPVDEAGVEEAFRKRVGLAEEEFAAISPRAMGFAGKAALFAGLAEPLILEDPLALASMFIGIGSARSVLSAALRTAAVSAVTEVPIQAAVQFGKREVGLGGSVEEGLRNIALVGAAGGLLGAAAKGVGKGLGRLGARVREAERAGRIEVTPDIRRAAEFNDRLTDIMERNPFPAFARAERQFVRNFDEAFLALHERRIAKVPSSPDVPPQAEAFETTALPEALRVLGEDLGEELAGPIELVGKLRAFAAKDAARATFRLRNAFAAQEVLAEPGLGAALVRVQRAFPIFEQRETLLRLVRKAGKEPTEAQAREIARERVKLARMFKKERPLATEENLDRFIRGEDELSQSRRILRALGTDPDKMREVDIRAQLEELTRALPEAPEAAPAAGRVAAGEQLVKAADVRGEATARAEVEASGVIDELVELPEGTRVLREALEESDETIRALEQAQVCAGLRKAPKAPSEVPAGKKPKVKIKAPAPAPVPTTPVVPRVPGGRTGSDLDIENIPDFLRRPLK